MIAPELGSLPLDLKEKIDAILAKRRGPVAIACLDRVTGRSWELDGERAFAAGQLSALPLLMHAYETAQDDALDWEALRPLLHRTVAECNGEAITQLAGRLSQSEAGTLTARALLERLAALDAHHPLWELLAWEGDRTKFPRRLSGVPMAYKAADRCELQLAHAAGRLGASGDVLLVILTEGDPAANSLIGRLAKVIWDYHQDQLDQARRQAEALEALRAQGLPDRRLGLCEVQVTWKDGNLCVTGETTLPESWFSTLDAVVAVEHLRGEPVRVIAPVLNLRREPRHGAELVSQAPHGTPLTLLKRPEGEWFRVQTPDGYVAWGRSDNLSPEPIGEEGLRTLPIVLAAQRQDGGGTVPLAAGSELRIREREAGRWLAETALGDAVWIPESEAIAAPDRPMLWQDASTLGARAVAIAEGWLGIPYLWGGKSGWGLDCSGLTQLVYELLGLRLPRDADQQAKALPAVPRWEELVPGDLLFYPGHVALWAGEGAVIHASSPRGGVVREAVAQVPWLRERCTSLARPAQARPALPHPHKPF
ncbi:Dipeptidyl-peptidase 6 [compost metagenome]